MSSSTVGGPTCPAIPAAARPQPRTAAGVGSTLAELRAASGDRVTVSSGPPGMGDRFQVRFGAAGELSGSLSRATPTATVTGIAARAGGGA